MRGVPRRTSADRELSHSVQLASLSPFLRQQAQCAPRPCLTSFGWFGLCMYRRALFSGHDGAATIEGRGGAELSFSVWRPVCGGDHVSVPVSVLLTALPLACLLAVTSWTAPFSRYRLLSRRSHSPCLPSTPQLPLRAPLPYILRLVRWGNWADVQPRILAWTHKQWHTHTDTHRYAWVCACACVHRCSSTRKDGLH